MKKQILKDEPNFCGIAINDAVPLQTIIELGVTMAWTLNPRNKALNCKKVLVAGNNKDCHPCYKPIYGKHCHGCHERINQKGFYFIAEIERIERCSDFISRTKGMADESFRKHHCFFKYPIIGAYPENKPRYAVYFKNSVEIEIKKFSSSSFKFPQNPVIYIP